MSEHPTGPDYIKEPDIASLDKLFSTSPSLLDDKEFDKVIEELVRMRTVWLQAEAAGKRAPKAQKVKEKKPIDDILSQELL